MSAGKGSIFFSISLVVRTVIVQTHDPAVDSVVIHVDCDSLQSQYLLLDVVEMISLWVFSLYWQLYCQMSWRFHPVYYNQLQSYCRCLLSLSTHPHLVISSFTSSHFTHFHRHFCAFVCVCRYPVWIPPPPAG